MIPPINPTPWTDALMAMLTELWEQGLSARKIGMVLKIGKNAVIGKAKRLGLSLRPSPIIRREPAPARVKALPAVPVEVVGEAPVPAPVPVPVPVKRKHKRQAPAAPSPPPQAVVHIPQPHFARCQWLTGNDRKTWLQCDGAAVSGKPYCLKHCRKAYVPHVRRCD